MKVIFFLILNLQEVSTNECGNSVNCLKSPASCTSSENCEMLILHKHDSNTNTIDLTISTNSTSKYVSFAQNEQYTKMVSRLSDEDVTLCRNYICYPCI